MRDLVSECGAEFEADDTFVMSDDAAVLSSLDDGSHTSVTAKPNVTAKVVFPTAITKRVAYRGVGMVCI